MNAEQLAAHRDNFVRRYSEYKGVVPEYKASLENFAWQAYQWAIADAAIEIAGWEADQKENLRNQCDLQAEINRLTAAQQSAQPVAKLGDPTPDDLYAFYCANVGNEIKHSWSTAVTLLDAAIKKFSFVLPTAAINSAAAQPVELQRVGLTYCASYPKCGCPHQHECIKPTGTEGPQ